MSVSRPECPKAAKDEVKKLEVGYTIYYPSTQSRPPTYSTTVLHPFADGLFPGRWFCQIYLVAQISISISRLNIIIERRQHLTDGWCGTAVSDKWSWLFLDILIKRLQKTGFNRRWMRCCIRQMELVISGKMILRIHLLNGQRRGQEQGLISFYLHRLRCSTLYSEKWTRKA